CCRGTPTPQTALLGPYTTLFRSDRAGERQTGELGGDRRGVDREHDVRRVGVERHDGDDDLDLVAQPLLEGRAQRPVDQAAGEDRDRKSTRLNSSHVKSSYAVFCM